MADDSTPINFRPPSYPPSDFKPLKVSYPTLSAADAKRELLGHDEEFPKIPVEPATLAKKEELWLQGGVETETGKAFTQMLRDELVRAGFMENNQDL